jgi:superfamily II DNA/RNA helicase
MYTDVIHAALTRTFAQEASGGVHKIHGKLEPRDRAKASAAFRERQRSVLVSTDASSRGVDYDGLTIVIQLGFTSRSEFLQRAGRVGRAGAVGEAVAVYDPAEARVVLREACKDTQETCIGDMVLSRAVSVLQAVPKTGEGSRPRSLGKERQVRFDPASFDPSILSSMRDTNPSRVFGTWIGGVGSNWKRLGIPQEDVIDWARRFAAGIGANFNEGAVKAKLKMRY